MIDDELAARVLQLHQTEKLSIRQIAAYCGLCRKTVSRIIRDEGKDPSRYAVDTLVKPYWRLIESWYAEFPKLKAMQVFERLKGLGFVGSCSTVERATRKLRTKKPIMYHERVLLPGEEAQVDWMVLTLPWGTVYGFVYVLAWSRYLVLRFYPHMTFEFFLDGHLEAFRECMGIAHAHRYDNLKSVVISRKPVLRLNAQFVDFSRHYGFAIHPCTPYRPNEKGRVERVIRDIRSFLYTQHPKDLADLNRLVDQWQRIRNNSSHSMTGRSPSDASFEEPLKKLPAIGYPAKRAVVATVSKTGFVEVDSNRYSVPSHYSGQSVTIAIYPEKIEVIVNSHPVASHRRSFAKKQTIEHPTHRTDLLEITPAYKQKRIYLLMTRMHADIARFIQNGERDGNDPLKAAHTLFRLRGGALKIKQCRSCAYGEWGLYKNPCKRCYIDNKNFDNPFSMWEPKEDKLTVLVSNCINL
ncbi:MAG: IS21 family transposase [Proteobacteria bacterium]|nr:IS21 family transposase [Pseudomonadota bacterium]